MLPLAIGTALLGYALGRRSGARASGSAGPAAPLPGVGASAWESFVARMATAQKGHVSERARLGTFQMDARRLADVGAMRRAWKGTRGGVAGVWVGEWCEGLTEDSFLGSMPLQYAVFVRSIRAAAPKVSPLVGSEVEEKKASLSGLLGVSHVAGIRGVEGFVMDPGVRARFPSTAEVFRRTNGIF